MHSEVITKSEQETIEMGGVLDIADTFGLEDRIRSGRWQKLST